MRSNAKRTTFKGIPFKSKLEADYAHYLEILRLGKEVKSWEYEGKNCCFRLIVNGFDVGGYTIDFKVVYTNGVIELVEVKGYETPIWRIRWKLLKACYPGENFKLIKKVPKIR